jgi:hypothetical protein
MGRILRQELTRNNILASYALAHPAQHVCLANIYMSVVIGKAEDLPEGVKVLADQNQTPMTMAGIPIYRDHKIPMDEIRFYDEKSRLIAEIVHLALPPV